MAEKDLTEKILEDYPDGLEPFVNDYKIHVFEVAWLSDEQIANMTSDFKIIAEFFRDKRLGTDTVANDSAKIKHVDEVLKLLSVFTGDSRYEEVIQCENYEEVDSMCEIMDRAVNKGITLGESQGQNKLIALWNWLTASGRSDEAVEIMKPSNEVLRKTLFAEYENVIQKKQE